MAARRSKALACDDIHNRPTASRAANTRLFMGGSSNDRNTGRRKRKQRTQRVAGTAGPALLLAFAAAVTVTVSDCQHALVLNLGVLSSTPFVCLHLSAGSPRFSPICRADCAEIAVEEKEFADGRPYVRHVRQRPVEYANRRLFGAAGGTYSA